MGFEFLEEFAYVGRDVLDVCDQLLDVAFSVKNRDDVASGRLLGGLLRQLVESYAKLVYLGAEILNLCLRSLIQD